MIKKFLLGIAIVGTMLLGAQMANAQTGGMAINTTGAAPNASAMLDVTSTTKGILVSRMTTTQMNAISSPATGLLIYNTTTGQFNYYNGSAWTTVGGSPTGSAGGDLAGTYPNPTIASTAGAGNDIVTAINASGGGLSGTKLATNSVSVNALSATGTPSSSTYLRGDNTWATVSGGSGTVTSVSSGNLSPLFTTSVSNATTTPTISYSLNNTPIYSVLTNSTGAISTPVYGKVHPNALLNLGGTANSTTYYRGDGQWVTPSGGGFTWAGGGNPASSATVTSFFNPPNSYLTSIVSGNTSGSFGTPVPVACTLDAIYLSGYISNTGANTDVMSITVWKNEVATSMTISITFPSGSPVGTVLATVSTITNPVTFAAGDRIAIQVSNPNPSVAYQSGLLKWSLHFQ